MAMMARRPFMSKLFLHIGSDISLKDFSFSQLIISVKNLFDTEVVLGLVKALVTLLEQILIRSGIECHHCKSNKLHRHSEKDRRIKTSRTSLIDC